MVALLRIATTSSSRQALLRRTVAAAPSLSAAAKLHTSLPLAKQPTGSEEAVRADKHDQDDIDRLAQKTSEQSTQEFQRDNKSPSTSEENVHADRHAHDPLPDDKKKGSSKPSPP